jgi:hypothetical protein
MMQEEEKLNGMQKIKGSNKKLQDKKKKEIKRDMMN